MEVIVLAGGLGTRLQGVIGDMPKCMAPLNGKPFLSYLFNHIDRQGCTRAILSLGFKADVVIKWLEQEDLRFELDYVIESEPLGTGGGIKAAMEETVTDNVAVVNGDTLFMSSLRKQMAFHTKNKALTTLALKEMHNFDRYGVVKTNDADEITAFGEKQFQEAGYINGGVYVINREAFLAKKLSDKFSFEKDYLERFVTEKKFFGYKTDEYFIDIGVPEDYARAQNDFKTLFPNF